MKTLKYSPLILIFLISTALAAPNLLRFQGRLTNSEGSPISGQPRVRFAIYNVGDGGAAVWAQPQLMTVNSNDNGLFSTNIDVPAAIFNTSQPLFLEVIVQGIAGEQPMSPRQQLTSVPFAFGAANADRASLADDVADLSITSEKIANGAVMRSKIADNAVGAIQIEDGSVSFLDIAPDAIRSEHIQDESVEFVDLATDAVTSDNIQDGSVRGVDLATDSITTDHLIDNSVNADKLQLDSVSRDHLDNSVQEYLQPGMIVMFAGGCPSGWSTLTEAEGRFPRGKIDGDSIVTGGTDTISGMTTAVDGDHQHQISSNELANHTHQHHHRHVSPVSVPVDDTPAGGLIFPLSDVTWGQGKEFITLNSQSPTGPTPNVVRFNIRHPFLKTSSPDADETSSVNQDLSLISTESDGPHSHEILKKDFLPSFFSINFCVKS